jgi:hypothetical protein
MARSLARLAALLIATLATPAAAQFEPKELKPLILETVVAGRRLVPQDPDGSYRALPAAVLRIRVQSDLTSLKVAVNDAELPRRVGPSPAEGWYEPVVTVLSGAARPFFADLVVNLPLATRAPTAGGSTRLTVAYDPVRTDLIVPPPLNVELVSWYRDPPAPPLPWLASEIFDEGDNSKPDGRAMSAIVARGVVLAGWVHKDMPMRNDGGPGVRPGESEDYHYDLWLDNDFIVRNYTVGSTVLEPVASAVIPGNPVPLFAPFRPPVPRIPLVSSGIINAATFTIPGSELLTAELNAWHKADRGAKPDGWVDDPDQQNYPGNAWSFHPWRPLGVEEGGADLQASDYVIISGTLWEDTSHPGGGDPNDVGAQFRGCWDDKLRGHGGWLEIHPVDSIRVLRGPDRPAVRKHVVMRAACDPVRSRYDEWLAPIEPPPTPNSALKFETLIDGRFTSTNVDHSAVVEPTCPTMLHARAAVGPGGMFKASYVLWWEEASQARAPDTGCPMTTSGGLDARQVFEELYYDCDACPEERDACLAEVTEPGGPRPQTCSEQYRACLQCR